MSGFDLAHDQELYRFEGETNAPLEQNADIRDALYAGWEDGFAQGYNRALADAMSELQSIVPYNFELFYDGTEDTLRAAYVDGVHDS